MSQDKNAGWSHNIKIDKSSFERMEQFKYMGINLMNPNFIQQTEVRECLLSFGGESFVFQFAIQKFKD